MTKDCFKNLVHPDPLLGAGPHVSMRTVHLRRTTFHPLIHGPRQPGAWTQGERPHVMRAPAVPLYFPTVSLYRSLLEATWKKSYTA